MNSSSNVSKRSRLSDSPIQVSNGSWFGSSCLHDPNSMLCTLENQLMSLPATDDAALLSVYWSLYVSYVTLKGACQNMPVDAENTEERARKSIVVIGNLQESSSTRPSERISHDCKLATELCDNADIESSIVATQRLGPKSDRPRLIKLFFQDPESASRALSKLSKYKRSNQHCKLTFRPSLTRQERDERRRLFDKCQEQRLIAKREGRDDDYIVYANEVTLRCNIGLVRDKLKKQPTGANLVPLGIRNANSTLQSDMTKFPWLQAACENSKAIQFKINEEASTPNETSSSNSLNDQN